MVAEALIEPAEQGDLGCRRRWHHGACRHLVRQPLVQYVESRRKHGANGRATRVALGASCHISRATSDIRCTMPRLQGGHVRGDMGDGTLSCARLGRRSVPVRARGGGALEPTQLVAGPGLGVRSPPRSARSVGLSVRRRTRHLPPPGCPRPGSPAKRAPVAPASASLTNENRRATSSSNEPERPYLAVPTV